MSEPMPESQKWIGWIIGAYAAAPSRIGWNPQEEARYLDALADLPGVVGLEVPFADSLHKFDEQWLFDHLRSDATIVVTTAPGTSDRARASPTFGLSSTDPGGRQEALDHAAQVGFAIKRLNDALGRPAVVAVELHSAPRHEGGASSAAALLQSLDEMSAWDWGGARLVVEHCDAAIRGQPPAKGYLTLDDEIDTVLEVNRRTGAGLGIAINWGRSVIECRDPDAARQHVQRAREADLLAGIIFSGCSDAATQFGGPWADVHVPAAPAVAASAEGEPFGFLEPTSLMTVQRIAETLRAAGAPVSGSYRGIKTAAPPTASVEERIAAVSQSLELVRAGASLITAPPTVPILTGTLVPLNRSATKEDT